MSEAKHPQGELHTAGIFNPGTPRATQWIWSGHGSGEQSGEVVAKDVKPANAARIILAWNCHDELVAALESVEWNGLGEFRSCPSCFGWKPNGHKPNCKLAVAICKAKGVVE